MSVNYMQLAGNKILVDNKQTACYSEIFNGGVREGATKIILYEPRLYLAGGEKQFKVWINILNHAGFFCKYLGKGLKTENITIDANYFVVEMDLTKYKYREQLLSALTLLRYAFESEMERYVDDFFKAKKALPKLTTIELIYVSHYNYYGSGHSLHLERFQQRQTKKELFAAFAKNNYPITERSHGQDLHRAWTTKPVKNKIPAEDPKRIYEIMKEKNVKTLVYVVGGAKHYANWLPNTKLTDDLKECEVVLFTGGEDVHPSLYNEPVGKHTYSNLERDKAEKELFFKARDMGKKFLGICRGSQFLCVMAGGRLVQHQENPLGVHPIKTAGYGDIHITSTHHQAAHPRNLAFYQYKIIGWTEDISKTHLDGYNKELDIVQEAEIVYYKNINALGIQGHPEFADYQRNHPESLEVLKTLFTKFVNDQPL